MWRYEIDEWYSYIVYHTTKISNTIFQDVQNSQHVQVALFTDKLMLAEVDIESQSWGGGQGGCANE